MYGRAACCSLACAARAVRHLAASLVLWFSIPMKNQRFEFSFCPGCSATRGGDSWDQVAAVAASAAVIVGLDAGFDRLWIWNKLAADDASGHASPLPPSYLWALNATA